MKIGLIIDNPRRDLTGMCLLASELANLNHEVLLIPMNLNSYEVPYHLPDYLLLPGFRKNSINNYQDKYDLGIILGVMETEGGFYLHSLHRLNILEDSPKVNEIIRDYFVWGLAYKELLLQTKSIDEQKIHITGHPKMDVLKKNLTPKAIAKSAILFCSNFTVANGFLKNESMIAGMEKAGVIGASSYYDGLVEMKREFIDLAKELANSGSEVIFRPHPFEDTKFYLDVFKETNVTLDLSNDAIDSIDKSFVVIQNSSTTGIEAILRNVPTIIPDYISNGYHIKAIRDVSFLAKSRDNFFELINLARENKLKDFVYSKELNNVLFINERLNAAQQIATIISRSTPKPKLRKGPVSYRFPIKKQIKAFIKAPFDFKGFKKYVIGNSLLSWDKTYKCFKVSDVENQLEKLGIGNLKVTATDKSRSILISK
jgi:surface carbohydrate biosynthesis protein